MPPKDFQTCPSPRRRSIRRIPFSTTRRPTVRCTDEAIAARSGFADVLLHNEKNEVTESTIANLVVEIAGELVTPPVECGLLPGTLRAQLLEDRKIREGTISVTDMLEANARYLLNSVRGFHPISVITEL